MTSAQEAMQTVLKVHDAARDLERDEGFPGMFEQDGSGEIAALRGIGFDVTPIGPCIRRVRSRQMQCDSHGDVRNCPDAYRFGELTG